MQIHTQEVEEEEEDRVWVKSFFMSSAAPSRRTQEVRLEAQIRAFWPAPPPGVVKLLPLLPWGGELALKPNVEKVLGLVWEAGAAATLKPESGSAGTTKDPRSWRRGSASEAELLEASTPTRQPSAGIVTQPRRKPRRSF